MARTRIATEAARGLVAWLGGQPAQTVIAHLHPSYHASATVATACGLTPTDVTHDGEIRWQRILPGQTAHTTPPSTT